MRASTLFSILDLLMIVTILHCAVACGRPADANPPAPAPSPSPSAAKPGQNQAVIILVGDETYYCFKRRSVTHYSPDQAIEGGTGSAPIGLGEIVEHYP